MSVHSAPEERAVSLEVVQALEMSSFGQKQDVVVDRACDQLAMPKVSSDRLGPSAS
jgi:hypothetical protein